MPNTISGTQVVGFTPIAIRGADGRSITSAVVNGAGHLILTYSDGTTGDAGLVAGTTGGVTTVFGRSGAVVATTGDYTAAQVGAAASTHASTHASGGSDPVTLAESQVTNLVADLAARLLNGTPTTKTANYTAAIGDIVLCDTTGGTFTVTIPAANGGKGRVVVKWVAGTTAPTIAASGTDHFTLASGVTSFSPTLLNQGYQLESDNSAVWVVTADDLPLSQLDARYPLLSTLTTKGDLYVATGSGALTRVGVGANNQVLTADSSQAAGVKWAAGGSANPYAQIKTGSSLWHASGSTATSQGAISAGTMRCVPIYIDRSCTLIGLRIWTNSFVASSAVRLGIYADSGSGEPGSLTLDAGTVDTSTASGVKDLTINQALTPGLYWLAAVQQGGASALTWMNNSTNGASPYTVHDSSTNNFQFGGYDGYTHNGSVTGALPATFLPTTLNDGRCPKIGIKVS